MLENFWICIMGYSIVRVTPFSSLKQRLITGHSTLSLCLHLVHVEFVSGDSAMLSRLPAQTYIADWQPIVWKNWIHHRLHPIWMRIHSEKLLAISCRLETAAHLCGHIGFLCEQVINVLVVYYTTLVVNEVMCLDKYFPALCGVVELLSM